MAFLKNTRYLDLFYGQLSFEKRDKCTNSEFFVGMDETGGKCRKMG
jgi:hypothetical protein